MDNELIAVTGATGNIGSRVATRLAELGVRQRLLVRDPSRAPRANGAEVRIVSSYAATAEMRAALEGAHTVLLVPGREQEDRLAEHRSAVDAIAAAGVRTVVYLSWINAAPDAIFTLARDHDATEGYLRGTGIPCTFLRMSLYMDSIPLMTGADGVIAGPAADGRVAAVLRRDVADSAVAALLSERHLRQTYDLTGPEAFTFTEAAEVMSRISGKTIRFHNETVDEAYASRGKYQAPDWEVAAWVTTYTAIAAGDLSHVSDSVRVLTGHEPVSLTEYLGSSPHSLDHVVAG